MSNTIYILRHAKTKRDYAKYQDYERPLSKRGIKDATKLGKWMQQLPQKPDLVIASNALRGRDTADIVAKSLGIGADKIRYEQSMYGATVNRWLQQLRKLDGRAVQCVLIVGHNPEMEQLAGKLAGIKTMRVPPCGLIGIHSKATWKNLGMAPAAASTSLLWSNYPQRYKELRPEISSITAAVAKEAVKALPAGIKDAEATHLISESIFAAISKIVNNRPPANPGRGRPRKATPSKS